MKKVIANLLTALALLSATACSSESSSDLQRSLRPPHSITLEEPAAGIDYPTDTPIFKNLVGKLVLVINTYNRVIVDSSTELVPAEAGIDFPTDTPPPASLINVKILALENNFRLPVRIEQAKAGIDFPTDGPATLERDFLIWDMGRNQRVRLSAIDSIERAVAGIDFPTDGRATLERDFYVYTRTNADYSRSRVVIRASRRN